MRPVVALLFLLGSLASVLAEPLVPGQWHNGTVPAGQYQYFTIDVAAEHGELSVAMIGKSGDPDLYLRFALKPTKDEYDAADMGIADEHQIVIRSSEGAVRLQEGRYHVAVYAYGNDPAAYALKAVLHHCPGGCSGHGTCKRAEKKCSCDPGYITDKIDCSAQLVKMSTGDSYTGVVERSRMLYVEFDLNTNNTIELSGRIQRLGGHAVVAAYMRRGAFPNADASDAQDYDLWGSRSELRVRIIQERIRTGKWYLAVDNERETSEPFPFKLTLSAYDCPNGCSGHGKCQPTTHTCTCDPMWIGSKDCSVATLPLGLGVDTPMSILGHEKTSFRVVVPDEAQQTGSEMVVKVRTHKFQTGSPVYPRVYLNPITVPDSISHWAANRLPQQGDTALLRVARDDIIEQGNKWYVQLDNEYEHPVNVSVRVTLQAYCANGKSSVRGLCVCDSGYTGKNCEESGSHLTPGIAVLVAFLTMAFGIVIGFCLKRAFPHWCARKEDNNLQYNHLDR